LIPTLTAMRPPENDREQTAGEKSQSNLYGTDGARASSTRFGDHPGEGRRADFKMRNAAVDAANLKLARRFGPRRRSLFLALE
jgi:hypothetical protein